MVFMGRGFTSGGKESGSVFSEAVCKILAAKSYVESLVPLVLKDKGSCFSQGQVFAVQLPLDRALAPGSWMLNWHFETIYMQHFTPTCCCNCAISSSFALRTSSFSLKASSLSTTACCISIRACSTSGLLICSS